MRKAAKVFSPTQGKTQWVSAILCKSPTTAKSSEGMAQCADAGKAARLWVPVAAWR
jgi:hypothetical protein